MQCGYTEAWSGVEGGAGLHRRGREHRSDSVRERRGTSGFYLDVGLDRDTADPERRREASGRLVGKPVSQ